MAITSVRTETITYTGDSAFSLSYSSAQNVLSPAGNDVYTLASGANTITLPTGGSTPKAATIIPPAGNTQTLTLKGVTGDTGIALHKTDPTVIALESTVVNFVLTAGGTITGLRIIWS